MTRHLPALRAAAVVALLLVTGCKRESSRESMTEPSMPVGPGREAFLASCQMCHGTRYVLDQPRFARKTWAAEVEKMRVAYGAPIPAENVGAIVDYLVHVNGTP